MVVSGTKSEGGFLLAEFATTDTTFCISVTVKLES